MNIFIQSIVILRSDHSASRRERRRPSTPLRPSPESAEGRRIPEKVNFVEILHSLRSFRMTGSQDGGRLRILLICLIVFFSLNLIGCGPDKKQDALNFFNDAGQAYKKGEYDHAIESYQKILTSGMASGEVYYNFANSYFKKGDLGKAILNYERARRLIPRDSDLLSNLKYARASIKNSPAERQKTFGERMLAYAGHLSPDEQAVAGLVLLLSLVAVHLLGLYFKWPASTKAGTLSIVIFIFAFHLFACFFQADNEKNAAVVLTAAEAKFEPEAGATTHFSAPEGLRVKIIEENSGWVKVERPDGNEGWLPSGMVEKI